MKKKILCLALCVIMVFASFVGCEEESREDIMNEIGRKASEGALTVTMYLLSEKPVTNEQEAIVEAAVNEYMDDYNVYLDIKYFTEADYYKTLETNLDLMVKKAIADKANKKNQNKGTTAATTDATGETSAATEATTAAPETNAAGEKEYLYIDENGLPKVYYPPNDPFHVDIFYFGGYDRYLKYKNVDINGDGKVDAKDGQGYFADFSTPIKDTNAKNIKHGVSSVLYEGVKTLNDKKYNMMPCNTQIGEYTYLLLNKDLLNSTQYTAAQISDLSNGNCAEFLKFVSEYYTDYVPLYSSEATLPAEFNGYTATADVKDKSFAVGYVKGDIALRQEYADDYEVVVLETPKLEKEALYEHAFAISAYTKQLAKTALVLSVIYTEENVINLLAHGVEGVNYNWTNSDVRDENYEFYRVVEKITDDKDHVYDMDPSKIGNAALVYPTVDENPRRTDNILNQNSEATPAF